MEIWLVAGVAVTAAVVVFALLNRRSGQVIDAPRQAPTTSTVAGAQVFIRCRRRRMKT